MAISQRYTPNHAPGDSASYGIDMSMVLPYGVAIAQVGVAFWTNATPPQPGSGITGTGGGTNGKQAWLTVNGGTAGVDYQLRWSVTDSLGNIWTRTGLLLCAQTS